MLQARFGVGVVVIRRKKKGSWLVKEKEVYGVFDKRFGFKCEGGKVLGVSLIDSRTYS